MKILLEKTGIYLLVFVIAIESSACATTQPAVSESPGNITLQDTNKPGFDNTQSSVNQAVAGPEEPGTEDGQMNTFAETAGKVATVVLGAALIILYLGLSGGCCY